MVASDDVPAPDEVSDDAPSGKMGTTVGTEGVMLAEEEGVCVRVDAMIDMVVVLGDSVDGTLELVAVPGCEVNTDSEGLSVLLVVASDQAPLHVGGVTGVITGIDTTDELALTHVL